MVSANLVPDTNDEIIVSLSDISGLSLSSFDIEDKHEPKYPQNDMKSLMYILNVIKDKQESVKLLSFFKGLNIVNPATIQEVYENSIVVKTESTQVKAASLEKTVVLRSPLLSKDLSCSVIKSVESEQLLVLGSFEQIERSPSQRQFPRLSPAIGTTAKVFLNAREYSGDILDISMNSVKIFMSSLPPGTKGDNEFKFETKLSVGNDLFEIKSGAKALRNEEKSDGYEVVFLLNLQKDQEQKIVEYIQKRQIELIREFKSLKEVVL